MPPSLAEEAGRVTSTDRAPRFTGSGRLLAAEHSLRDTPFVQDVVVGEVECVLVRRHRG
jgi:hypothetical protein